MLLVEKITWPRRLNVIVTNDHHFQLICFGTKVSSGITKPKREQIFEQDKTNICFLIISSTNYVNLIQINSSCVLKSPGESV